MYMYMCIYNWYIYQKKKTLDLYAQSKYIFTGIHTENDRADTLGLFFCRYQALRSACLFFTPNFSHKLVNVNRLLIIKK